jgi:hypothetical protein
MDDWKSLRVGDRIRVVRLPSTFGQLAPDTKLAPEEVRLYKKLLASRKQLTVTEIDKDGRPWIRCCFRQRNGRLEIHYLAVDDDSWVRVRPRGRK